MLVVREGRNRLKTFVCGGGAVVQGGLLGPLIKRWGERRLALVALSFGVVEFIGFAFAVNGSFLVGVIILCFLAGASHPAVMGLISQGVPETEQGAVMGAIEGAFVAEQEREAGAVIGELFERELHRFNRVLLQRFLNPTVNQFVLG